MVTPELKCVYFLGIGGIGMSAIARCFNARGVSVSGYDKTPTPLTDELIAEGIPVHFEERIDLIPAHAELVVYTPAVPVGNTELIYIKEHGYTLRKRSEVLAMLVDDMKTLAIAGTHGKTSITSVVSHILKKGGFPVTAFIGGICKNYNSNFISSENSTIAVVEADEYDRSFLKLHPDIAVISAMDADHLDIYGTKETVEESYALFAANIRKGGFLIHKSGLRLPEQKDATVLTYAASGTADFHAENIRIEHANFIFDLRHPNGIIQNIVAGVPGRHNIENAIAAAAACFCCGLDEERIKTGIESYTGVKRRFDYHINTPKMVYIDDYGHHPEELRTFINSVRELYPEQKITGIFQPHLYSRTRDFADEFAKSLKLLDRVYLMDIYPARELPIEGVTSKMLLDKIELPDKKLLRREAVIDELLNDLPEVLLTLGAGDIDQLVEPIEHALKQKIHGK